MSYNFDFAVSATISQKVVEEMIKKVVEEQTGRKVLEISFKTTGYSDQMDRYTSYVCDGCTVKFADANDMARGQHGDR